MCFTTVSQEPINHRHVMMTVWYPWAIMTAPHVNGAAGLRLLTDYENRLGICLRLLFPDYRSNNFGPIDSIVKSIRNYKN